MISIKTHDLSATPKITLRSTLHTINVPEYFGMEHATTNECYYNQLLINKVRILQQKGGSYNERDLFPSFVLNSSFLF